MYNSKKAQISDTISWGVATIIIVLILSIPILLIETGIFGKKGILLYRTPDAETAKDLIVTKSISGYFLKNYDLIIKKDLEKKEFFSVTNPSLGLFLSSMSRDEKEESWNLVVRMDGKKVYPETLPSNFLSGLFRTYFYFNEEGKTVSFEFFRRGSLW